MGQREKGHLKHNHGCFSKPNFGISVQEIGKIENPSVYIYTHILFHLSIEPEKANISLTKIYPQNKRNTSSYYKETEPNTSK